MQRPGSVWRWNAATLSSRSSSGPIGRRRSWSRIGPCRQSRCRPPADPTSWLPHGEGGDRGIARCIDASLRSDGRIEPAHRHLPAREEHLASLGIDCMELAVSLGTHHPDPRFPATSGGAGEPGLRRQLPAAWCNLPAPCEERTMPAYIVVDIEVQRPAEYERYKELAPPSIA